MSDHSPRAQIYDSLEESLQQLKGIGIDDIHLNLKDPKVAKFLAQQYKLRLLELISQRKNIIDLQRLVESNNTQREEYRIENARYKEREQVSMFEFPLGVILGIAGNTLMSDIKNILAWGILIFGIIFYVIVRLNLLKRVFSREQMKGDK